MFLKTKLAMPRGLLLIWSYIAKTRKNLLATLFLLKRRQTFTGQE